MIPPFGKTTIRRFDGDVSALKRLTGDEIEDRLQVYTFVGVDDSRANRKILVYHPLH